MKKMLVLLLFGVFLGCARSPQIHYYQLYYEVSAEENADAKKTLHVTRFRARAPFDRDQFVYMTTPYKVEFDFYRRWVESPDQMLTRLFIDHARQTGHFFVSSITPAGPHRVLTGEIRTFGEQIQNGKRHAVFSIFIEIMDPQQSEIILSQVFTGMEPIRGAGADAILAAMSQVTRRIFDDIMEKIQP